MKIEGGWLDHDAVRKIQDGRQYGGRILAADFYRK